MRRIRNKKGDLSMQVIVVAILALLVMVILIFIFRNHVGKASDTVEGVQDTLAGDEAECAKSNLKSLLGGKSSEDVPDKCKDKDDSNT